MLAISKSPNCSFSTLLGDLFESASSVVCLEIAFSDLLTLSVAEASAVEIGDDFLASGLFCPCYWRSSSLNQLPSFFQEQFFGEQRVFSPEARYVCLARMFVLPTFECNRSHCLG